MNSNLVSPPIGSAGAHSDASAPGVGVLPYMPQLDSLRAFAVLAVLLSHFVPEVNRYAQIGGWGVRLFFVLSGFLITGILLRGKQMVETGEQTTPGLLRSFYARRFLRLFPLLLATLTVTAVLDLGPVRETFFWHVTYLSNIYFALRGEWNGSVSHLWSLAVEEQFYLLWPWFILLLPRKRLIPGVLLLIASGPVFRLVAYRMGLWQDAIWILPFACVDTLGAGALLAIFCYRSGLTAVARSRLRTASLWAGGLLLIFLVTLRHRSIGGWIGYPLMDIALALLGTWLVAGAAVGFSGPAGKLLESKPLVYIGTISYGIYVNHLFLPEFTDRFSEKFGLPQLGSLWSGEPFMLNTATYAIALTLLSILTAALTWRFFERPINGLKRYFGYRAAPIPASKGPGLAIPINAPVRVARN